ncbi:MAG TPA: UbiA-like polyprenyltransferase [Bacteroidia bacterium]|nr:UbiA-like polyprenyltransferase [Bacteroidia bacterium]
MPKTTVLNFLSLVKFSHTIFALPFAIVGYFTAIKLTGNGFDLQLFLKVILCMVFARNSAMAFNRYADRKFDKINPRTFVREIPAGVISENAALLFVIINVLLFIITTKFINELCFYLSPIAIMVILGYSLTKRFTALCHFVLGLGLSLAPLGAFLAVTGFFDLVPMLFSISILFWVGGFDIIYALQDDDFDKSHHLKSIPVLLGRKGALTLSRAIHAISAIFLLLPGFYMTSSIFYFLGWGVFSALLVYQHSLVKSNDLSKVNLAFFTTNGIASVTFLIFYLIDYFS